MTPDDAGPDDRPTPAQDAGGADEDGRLVGGRYRLHRSLGRGGMGVVWAARDVTLDRDVAVKEVTLPPGLDERQRDQLRERTLREARAAARIRSEAAVTVYDVVEEDGRPWIVMELLPARSLADVVREEGPLPPDRAARTGLRLLDALAAAHAAGVLHRDVKPANVLFDATGRAVLTDFGIASLEGDPSMTTTGTVVGSPGYVAPERALGRAPTPASDLWSFGVTLAAAVHGRSPFEKSTPLATIVSAMQDALPDAVVTGPLGPVIDRLLSKDPARRPDIAETRRLLEAALAGAGPAAVAGTTSVLPAVVAGGAAPGYLPEGADAELTQALPRVPAAPGPREGRTGGPGRPLTAAGAGAVVGAAAAGGGAVRADEPPWAGSQPRPRPVPPAPEGRGSRLVPALLALVGVVAAVLVAFVLLDRRDGPSAAADGSQTTASTAATAPAAGGAADPAEVDEAPAASEPAPEDTAEAAAEETAGPTADAEPSAQAAPQDGGAQPGQAPAGFQLYEDPGSPEGSGYRVAVPEGWTVDVDSETRTLFQDPSSRRYLLVEEGGEPAGDPVEDWEAQEESVSQSGRLAGYELIGIERADYRDFDSADWQFRWQASGGPLRVLNRAVVDTEIDRAYALYWSVPEEEWDPSRPVFDSIAASFQPVG